MGRLRTISDEERKYRDDLAVRIFSARIARGLSKLEVGRRSGIHRNALSSYEAARMMPSPYSLMRLARAMDVSPGQLLRGPRNAVREPVVYSPGAVMGLEMLDPEFRNRAASGKTGRER